jgi:hypothetical protein
MTIYIGIDPGKSGAIFVEYSVEDFKFYDLKDLLPSPTSATFVPSLVNGIFGEIVGDRNPSDFVAVMENVRGFDITREGKKAYSASNSFNFGMNKGLLLCAIDAIGIRSVFLVDPLTWKASYRLGSNKTSSVELAIRMRSGLAKYLTMAKQHDRAEAFLLAQLGKQLGNAALIG